MDQANSEDEIRNALIDGSFFEKVLETYGNSVTTLSLWGGEPTINLPYLTRALDDSTIEKYFPKLRDISFSTNLSSDAGLQAILDLKDKMCSLVGDWDIKRAYLNNGMSVQVSVDGPAFIHDYNRLGSSVAAVLRRARSLRDSSIDVVFKGTLGIDSVRRIMKTQNTQTAFLSFTDYIESAFGVPFIPTPVLPYTWSLEEVAEYRSFYMMLHDHGKDTWVDKLLAVAIETSVRPIFESVFCSAGKPYNVAIDKDTNIYFCHHLFTKEQKPRSWMVKATTDLDKAKFRYVSNSTNNAFTFAKNYELSTIKTLAIAGLIDQEYYNSELLSNLLAGLAIQLGCAAGNFEDTNEALINGTGILKFLGNGILQDSIYYLRSARSANVT